MRQGRSTVVVSGGCGEFRMASSAWSTDFGDSQPAIKGDRSMASTEGRLGWWVSFLGAMRREHVVSALPPLWMRHGCTG